MALIKTEDLALGYEGKNIVERLSFTLERGDYLCIVGENGSGKTTLMNAFRTEGSDLGKADIRGRS